jgi:hypothetical protein
MSFLRLCARHPDSLCHTREAIRDEGWEKPDAPRIPGHQSHEPAGPRLRCERERYLHRLLFVGFESDLLREHDVTRGKKTKRHKAQAANRLSVFVELEYVLLIALLNAIALAGLRPNGLESFILLVLRELRGGEPFAQEGKGLALGSWAGHMSCLATCGKISRELLAADSCTYPPTSRG